MFFSNAVLFRFPTSTDFAQLEEQLAECRLKPVGPLELSSRGFVSPFGRDSELLAARQADAAWLAVGGEDRILPGKVVNDLLEKKLAEIEAKEGRRPGGRTRKRVKDELITEMLPRTFISPSRVDVLLDLSHGLVTVNSSSRKSGENVVSEIRRALGSFPALPLNAEIAPRSVLTSWVAGEALPDGLTLGEECELRDALDQGGVVKIKRMDLQCDEVNKHLQSGKQVTQLGLVLDERLSFVLGEDLVVRKIKLLDVALESLENTEREDQHAELDARFALMTGEVKRLFKVLESAFKISAVEA